ncbi:uncharacterized protein DC041_0004005 [Schistosoma bovis]|uniref:aspartate transaminase n=1 Tax=Schistosoma bovis TaxID=6184 RepID=A0A430QRJ5_SCHBO|nr:uncharacterized protein DC041_0004005 [Schistosoma bovis]
MLYVHHMKIHTMVITVHSSRKEKKTCVITMAQRIREMRQGLYERLRSLGTPGNWEHIINQVGMFSYTGLTLSTFMYLYLTMSYIYNIKIRNTAELSEPI